MIILPAIGAQYKKMKETGEMRGDGKKAAYTLCGDIIVVDDAPNNLELLTNMLTRRGHNVRPFSSGMPAIEAADAEPPDLFILDIDMPVMNGFDVCLLIKKKEVLKDIPVMFISGRTDSDTIIRAFEHGAVDFAGKPFTFNEVCPRIDAHIKYRRGMGVL